MNQSQPKIVKLSQSDLEELLQRLKGSNLADADKGLLQDIVHNQHWMYRLLETSKLSIKKFKEMVFGPASEKRSKKKAEPKEEEPEPVKKKGHGRNGAESYATRKQVHYSHPELKPGDACPNVPCTGRLYSLSPGSFIHIRGQSMAEVTEYLTQRLRCSACGLVVNASLPEGVEKYDASFKSILALERYYLGVPFYRQAGFQKLLGFPLSESVQWQLMEELAGVVIPVLNHLEKLSACGKLIHNDDTTVRILSLMGKTERSGMYTTGVVSFIEKHKIILFYSSGQHGGENMEQLLEHRPKDMGPVMQMCDALGMNRVKGHKVILCHCLVHARRKFIEIEADYPEECAFVIRQIGQIYHHDNMTKQMSTKERLEYHQKQSRPVIEAIYRYIEQGLEERRFEPNSNLGKAMGYMLRHREALTQFLVTPGAPLDNNITERSLKMPIRSRKNSLFHRTEYCAGIAACLMSVIYTCRENGVNPLSYLTALQRNKREVMFNTGAWLPWNYEEMAQAA